MNELLVLDYRLGGSSELRVGDALEDAPSKAAIADAVLRLISRGENEAVRLLKSLSFKLYRGTNGFDDQFLVVAAQVSPERLAQHRKDLRGASSPMGRAAAAIRSAVASAYESSEDEEVRFVALLLSRNLLQGVEGEYAYDEVEIDRGAFATVHRATNRLSDKVVAVKRLHQGDPEAIARMRREIQEQRRMSHAAVMPIVDHDPAYLWFVMPLADENLAAAWVRESLDNETILTVLRSIAEGLAHAHVLGLLHRDVTPRNILRIGTQWVVADWGGVRRPRGLTTMVRTRDELGSEGFAAPELRRDAHGAGASADVYALGRIAAWAVTRAWPEQNIPLLPVGPWRQLVRRTTDHDPARRPQTMSEVLGLLDEVERELRQERSAPADSLELARQLVARQPTPEASESLLELGVSDPANAELLTSYVCTVDDQVLVDWLERRADDMVSLVGAMSAHLQDRSYWSGRDFDATQKGIEWLRRVANLAFDRSLDGLLEDACGGLFAAEALWQRLSERQATRAWLASRRGSSTRTVARVLSRVPAAMTWLLAGWSPSATDGVIRETLQAHFDESR